MVSAKRCYYDSGLPFSEVLALTLDAIKDRVYIQNKVGLIIIDGGLGQGKTTLGTHCADYCQGAYTKTDKGVYLFNSDEAIDFKRHIGTGGDDFKKKLRACQKSKDVKVLIYDEAGDFNKRGSLSQFNARLNQIFEIYRAFQIVLIVILPSFRSLDGSLLEKEIPRLLIHTKDRGMTYGNFEMYSLKKMFFLLKNMKDLTIPSYAYKRETPTFQGHFLDLPKARAKQLDAFSISGKFDLLHMSNIREKGLMTYSQLAGRLNRSIPWVKKTILKMKLKKAETFKRVNYFLPEVMDVLARELEK